jgi:hypothetical protein
MAAPLDADRPLRMVIEEEPTDRTLEQNAAMWAGPLKDFAEQAFIEGRVFSARAWNGLLCEMFLPEVYDPELTKKNYEKWAMAKNGQKILIGSTKELTHRGFAEYMREITQYGAEMGIRFSVNPRTGR